MKSRVRVIARPEVTAGFELAGLPGIPARHPADAGDRLAELSQDPQVGVVLMQDTLFDALPTSVRARIARRSLPMVVPFPGPAWVTRAGSAEAYIVELLRQVVGYRVRLR